MQVQIQASTEPTFSPLQAEAHALVLAARVTQLLQIREPTFLTDNLSLAKAATSRNVSADAIPWSIRKLIAEFYNTTRQLQSQVFHISRGINGIAHNVAHQVLTRAIGPVFSCFSSTGPVISTLFSCNIQGVVFHVVHCY